MIFFMRISKWENIYALRHKTFLHCRHNGRSKSVTPDLDALHTSCFAKMEGDRGKPKHISTSYIERQNLTLRMQERRFTRLTNAFSKKLANHMGAVALYVAHYNFCRVHEALRVTPAMHLGVTDHVWTIGELVNAALDGEFVPP